MGALTSTRPLACLLRVLAAGIGPLLVNGAAVGLAAVAHAGAVAGPSFNLLNVDEAYG
jgi:hypothetical protein